MEDTTLAGKQRVIRDAKQSISRELTGGHWAPRERVALACRILHAEGHESGLAGQITCRESERSFLTQRLGSGLGEARASELLLIDEGLHVLEGSGLPNPANRFHAWLYRARPDIQCVVHTHPPYSSALSMLGVPLVIAHMDGCALYDSVAFLPEWPGVPVADEEGRLIAAALGDKSAVLLVHHGLVVVGHSVDEACVLALQFERAARLQLLASSAGEIRLLDRELGLEARDWLRTPARMAATFAYYARSVLAKDAQCLR